MMRKNAACLRGVLNGTDSAPDQKLRGTKRKACSSSSLLPVGDEHHRVDERDISGNLQHLVNMIAKDLEKPATNECIQLCGPAPLQILATRPGDVLELATEKLNAQQFAQVRKHWRRLYEDASLHKFVKLLKDQMVVVIRAEYRRNTGNKSGTYEDDWLSSALIVLEKGLMMSGAPGRKELFGKFLTASLPRKTAPDVMAKQRLVTPTDLSCDIIFALTVLQTRFSSSSKTS